MKSALRQVRMADLISSEAIGGRFHPSSLGFHPAKQDFIKFVWFVEIVFIFTSFFCFSRKIQIVHFIPFTFNLYGIVQLLIRLKELLISNRLCDIINSPKIQNLTATFKMINNLGGYLYD